MKRKLIFVALAVLILAGVTGCSQTDAGSSADTEEVQTSQEADDTTVTDSQTPVTGEEDQGTPTDATSEIQNGSGIYVGQADNNFIEINLSEVPGENSYKVFMLSQEIKETFDTLELEEGDNISFEYIVDEEGHSVIQKLIKI